jgi:hypothetical protein
LNELGVGVVVGFRGYGGDSEDVMFVADVEGSIRNNYL